VAHDRSFPLRPISILYAWNTRTFLNSTGVLDLPPAMRPGMGAETVDGRYCVLRREARA
jgi:hypothetical protein